MYSKTVCSNGLNYCILNTGTGEKNEFYKYSRFFFIQFVHSCEKKLITLNILIGNGIVCCHVIFNQITADVSYQNLPEMVINYQFSVQTIKTGQNSVVATIFISIKRRSLSLNVEVNKTNDQIISVLLAEMARGCFSSQTGLRFRTSIYFGYIFIHLILWFKNF